MHAMVYVVLTQPYAHARGVWPSYTMACILMSFLRAHTLSAVALISMAAVVQIVLFIQVGIGLLCSPDYNMTTRLALFPSIHVIDHC